MDQDQAFQEIIAFISYIDQLKGVIRKNALHDNTRQENTAEHSWHAALSALLLASYANQPIDINRVIKMLLIHDLVEIEAGDTFVYDDSAVASQEDTETQAVKEVFSRLPMNQKDFLIGLWNEFESRETPEAKFAKAIDRFLPLYSNIINHGYSWQTFNVSKTKVKKIASIINDGSTQLWQLVEDMLDGAVENGFLRP